MSNDKHLTELGEAARRAGSIVTEHIDAIVATAERDAEGIRQGAERDAEQARQEAFKSASRVFDRIQALERPLGELVQTLRVEMERVDRELQGTTGESPTAISSTAESLHVAEPAPEPAPEPEAEAPPTPEPEPEPERREEEPQPILVTPGAGQPEEPAAKPTRGILSRLRGGGSRKGAFITSQGHCAVCQKTFMAGSAEALELSGWRVSGDVGLCPEDQAQGWQLPEGARLPFRRGGS